MKFSILRKALMALAVLLCTLQLNMLNAAEPVIPLATTLKEEIKIPSLDIEKTIVASENKGDNKVISLNKIKHEEEMGEKPQDPKASMLFWTQLALLLVIIYFGIKYGGVALGMLGGLGVTLLVFVFGAIPAKPPIEVMLIILAVATTSATLEATGALGLIVKFAEKILRKNPSFVVFLAPMSTFFLTMLVGTGHAVYPLLPVIYDVSIKKGIRPERPMAVAAIASQLGITASPISAAAAALVGMFATAGLGVSLIDILKITIPSCFIGLLLASIWSIKRGKDLENDSEFQAKIADPEQRKYIFGEMQSNELETNTKSGRALTFFLLGILAIVILAVFPEKLLPLDGEGKPLRMSVVLQFVMFAVGAIILFVTNISAKKISDTKVFNAGMVAVIMIFGIAWMSESVIENNKPYILYLISDIVREHPWTFAIAMFCVSAFLKSQAAVLLVMIPLGISLGIPVHTLIACIPASYAYFFFCFYPSDLAAINFDRSGTTHAGTYLVNHSMMIPGMIAVWAATGIGFLLVNFL
ncbi:anaerobic C4-dicarboxylate transporter [Chryseobacterium oryctis]|uniref:Anaerobic C4-dicarboxylate transporter n=1 Tax=Chryseobacterium oryctis TaxID=2952618 RepID=A0ABT3HJ51_9FLAO|nr:anaerobic C4-dicarboxylate transporter [Chryseobacterium oryctis]MCW3159817.1 anaerobic C4-dicarboxylate transporter [Chryseobacterium oryctis]